MTKKKQTRAASFDEEKQNQAVKTVQTLTVEGVAKKLTDTQLAISKTLGDVTTKLQEQIEEFQKVSQAVATKQAELETLYSKESSLRSLDELEQLYSERQVTLEANYKAQVAKDEADRQTKDIERAQEEQQYQFTTQNKHRAEEEGFNEKMRLTRQNERAQSEQLVKEWKLREEALASKEKELVDLRQQVTDFPAKLDAEVKKAVAIAENSIKRELNHKAELQMKDSETAKMVADNTIKSLTDRLAASDIAIATLTNRLRESDEKVEKIANKALEAASSRQALSELQSVVQNQSNNTSMRKA